MEEVERTVERLTEQIEATRQQIFEHGQRIGEAKAREEHEKAALARLQREHSELVHKPCPVCSRRFPETGLAEHVEGCLQKVLDEVERSVKEVPGVRTAVRSQRTAPSRGRFSRASGGQRRRNAASEYSATVTVTSTDVSSGSAFDPGPVVASPGADGSLSYEQLSPSKRPEPEPEPERQPEPQREAEPERTLPPQPEPEPEPEPQISAEVQAVSERVVGAVVGRAVGHGASGASRSRSRRRPPNLRVQTGSPTTTADRGYTIPGVQPSVLATWSDSRAVSPRRPRAVSPKSPRGAAWLESDEEEDAGLTGGGGSWASRHPALAELCATADVAARRPSPPRLVESPIASPTTAQSSRPAEIRAGWTDGFSSVSFQSRSFNAAYWSEQAGDSLPPPTGVGDLPSPPPPLDPSSVADMDDGGVDGSVPRLTWAGDLLRILLTSVCFQVSVAGPLRDLKTLREEGVLVSSAQALQPFALSIHLPARRSATQSGAPMQTGTVARVIEHDGS